jgi:hypothetical protein
VCVDRARQSRVFERRQLQNNARLIGLYGIFSIGLGLVIITGRH